MFEFYKIEFANLSDNHYLTRPNYKQTNGLLHNFKQEILNPQSGLFYLKYKVMVLFG
jgi:hypothetical protein